MVSKRVFLHAGATHNPQADSVSSQGEPDMPALPTGMVRHNNGRYYLRRRIPLDLIDSFGGKQEIQRSLKTANCREAFELFRLADAKLVGECHASARIGLRHPHGAGTAGAFGCGDDDDKYPCVEQRRARGDKSAGSSGVRVRHVRHLNVTPFPRKRPEGSALGVRPEGSALGARIQQRRVPRRHNGSPLVRE